MDDDALLYAAVTKAQWLLSSWKNIHNPIRKSLCSTLFTAVWCAKCDETDGRANRANSGSALAVVISRFQLQQSTINGITQPNPVLRSDDCATLHKKRNTVEIAFPINADKTLSECYREKMLRPLVLAVTNQSVQQVSSIRRREQCGYSPDQLHFLEKNLCTSFSCTPLWLRQSLIGWK